MSDKLNLYLAGPITGCTYRGATGWRHKLAEEAQALGFNVYSPMRGKEDLKSVKRLRSHGYDSPMSTDKAIIRRDRFDVLRADVVLANLSGATIISVGTIFELAWAYDHGKYVIIVMENNNIHSHAFVEQSASAVVETLDDALTVLGVLASSV
jgi:nucleoside 2-deoxyribosyltransferase